MKEINFDPDEKYILYHIYPIPDDPKIKENVDKNAKHVFTLYNHLYFIITEEKYKEILRLMPYWVEPKKVGPSGLEDVIMLAPKTETEILKQAKIWSPSKYKPKEPGKYFGSRDRKRKK